MKKITEDRYYNIMYKEISKLDIKDFKKIRKLWYKCFHYTFKEWNNCSDEVIKDIFANFTMENWKAMHKENTEYKDDSKNKMFKHFCNECSYSADRMSYDRLFRCHWLFLRTFDANLDNEDLEWVFEKGGKYYWQNIHWESETEYSQSFDTFDEAWNDYRQKFITCCGE